LEESEVADWPSLFDDYDPMHPWVEVAIVVVGAGSVERERESSSMSHSSCARVEVDARIAVGAVRAGRNRIARIRRQTDCDCVGEAPCVRPKHRSAGRHGECATSGAVLESTSCAITAWSVVPNCNGRSRRGWGCGFIEDIDADSDDNQDNDNYRN